MKNTNNRCSGHLYPTEIISHAIWLYFHFTLSFRDVDEILATRGIDMIYECIREMVSEVWLSLYEGYLVQDSAA